MLIASTASQRINNIINKVEQFVNQYPGIYFFFLTKINQVAVDAITAGPPFVFIDQCALVDNEIQILRSEFINFGADSLK